MRPKEQLVRNFFNAIADKYDLTNLIISFGRCVYWRHFLIQKIGALYGATLLDVCCGTGKVTMDLAKKAGPEGLVIGLDISENMLTIARKNLEKRNAKLHPAGAQIRLIHGNAMTLPFPDNTFDCVTIAYGLRNMTDLKQSLLEIKRVVKPGGRVASLEMSKPRGLLFEKMYTVYAGQLIPLIGKIITKNKEAYKYLFNSIMSYHNPEEVTSTFTELGFKNTECYELTMGVATIHFGVKPDM